jgi:hypothetical protein
MWQVGEPKITENRTEENIPENRPVNIPGLPGADNHNNNSDGGTTIGKVESNAKPPSIAAGPTVELPFARGGFQGAEGTDAGAEWWIENVFQELDAAMEWYYEEHSSMLYYLPNATATAQDEDERQEQKQDKQKQEQKQGARQDAWQDEEFVATQLAVLFNISGTRRSPAHHVALRGLVLRDTRYTYFDPHGMPSGGVCV